MGIFSSPKEKISIVLDINHGSLGGYLFSHIEGAYPEAISYIGYEIRDKETLVDKLRKLLSRLTHKGKVEHVVVSLSLGRAMHKKEIEREIDRIIVPEKETKFENYSRIFYTAAPRLYDVSTPHLLAHVSGGRADMYDPLGIVASLTFGPHTFTGSISKHLDTHDRISHSLLSLFTKNSLSGSLTDKIDRTLLEEEERIKSMWKNISHRKPHQIFVSTENANRQVLHTLISSLSPNSTIHIVEPHDVLALYSSSLL